MIQLNLKPDKLLPSVFTSQPVIAHDTLGADTAMQALPLVFFVSIKDHSLVMLHFSLSLMGVCVGARGYMFKWEVLCLDWELREELVGNIFFCLASVYKL